MPPAGAGTAVAVRQGHVLATTFHPELTEDRRLHRYFLDMVSARQARPV
jgi:5'-phosphate synthase pdxT subunit